ncbi:MAG: hypothetical protein HZA52_08945 [Planctomycetes bacterium]|nr:hypothetical protein [Planctomycetota bacterium]
MPSPERRNPSRFLLEPDYWRERLSGMGAVSRGLLLFPRPDLSSPVVEVVEWSLRAHDGSRLWGLKGHSSFHPEPKGVWLREFDSADQPEISFEPIYDGCVDFAMQIPPGRRLEDRVLDVLRVWQAAASTCGVDTSKVTFVEPRAQPESDAFFIAGQLLKQGLCSLP